MKLEVSLVGWGDLVVSGEAPPGSAKQQSKGQVRGLKGAGCRVRVSRKKTPLEGFFEWLFGSHIGADGEGYGPFGDELIESPTGDGVPSCGELGHLSFGEHDLLFEAAFSSFEEDVSDTVDDGELPGASGVFGLAPHKVGDHDLKVSDDFGADPEVALVCGCECVGLPTFEQDPLLGSLSGVVDHASAGKVEEFVDGDFTISIEVGFAFESV